MSTWSSSGERFANTPPTVDWPLPDAAPEILPARVARSGKLLASRKLCVVEDTLARFEETVRTETRPLLVNATLRFALPSSAMLTTLLRYSWYAAMSRLNASVNGLRALLNASALRARA